MLNEKVKIKDLCFCSFNLLFVCGLRLVSWVFLVFDWFFLLLVLSNVFFFVFNKYYREYGMMKK